MLWGIFNKKNRTYTIGGVVAFVVIVYVVYRYAIRGTWIGNWFASLMGNPTEAVLGGAGWEAQTYKAPHYTRGTASEAISVPSEGAGLSRDDPITI